MNGSHLSFDFIPRPKLSLMMELVDMTVSKAVAKASGFESLWDYYAGYSSYRVHVSFLSFLIF